MTRFVSRITGFDSSSISCEWKISENEDFFRDHFEGMPVVPGLVMLESLVTAAAWLARASSDFNMLGFRLSELSNYKLPRIVKPGEILQVKVELIERRPDVLRFRGKAEVEGQSAAQGLFSLMELSTICEQDKFFYRDQCRTQFQQLLEK